MRPSLRDDRNQGALLLRAVAFIMRSNQLLQRDSTATALANNVVAAIAWDVDGEIDDCLAFEFTRV